MYKNKIKKLRKLYSSAIMNKQKFVYYNTKKISIENVRLILEKYDEVEIHNNIITSRDLGL